VSLDYDSVPLASLKPSEYRHPPFGETYRPFFERLSRVLAEVFPDTPEMWEDGFRRDLNPEREMELWTHVANCYEHFTQGQDSGLDRKKELFGLILRSMVWGPKEALKESLRHLSRVQAKDIVNYVSQATNGRVWPLIVSGRPPEA
jgi:hypothetical protein